MFDPTPTERSELLRRATEFIERRLNDGPPLGRTVGRATLDDALGETITPDGLGVADAFDRFERAVVPNCVGLDSARFLAFIPAAPSPSSVWFDAVVGAASFSGESWLEAAGAVHAENEVLRFLGSLAGLPEHAGGCFVSGGSAGNLSALAVARDRGPQRGRAVVVADTVHSSVDNALRLLGLEPLVVPTGNAGRLTGAAVRAALDNDRRGGDVAIVVGSAGSTNAGIVDALDGIAEVCGERGVWFHVDAAYGGAALLVDELRPRFAGIERADSVIIDPHKWLFAPLDCCALLYRDPAQARAVHTQHGPYLDVLHDDDTWNPADHAYHLTRRARGLPLWFGLAVHGTRAYADAVRHAVRLAAAAAVRFDRLPGVEVVLTPELGVVLFRRHGWDPARWRRWASDLLDAGTAFVAPTTWRGETVGRIVFLHPRTPIEIIDELADSLL